MKLYPNDWRVRVTSALVIFACMATAMMLGPAVGISGFWPFMLSAVVGIVLGQLVGRLLFGHSLGGPPHQATHPNLAQQHGTAPGRSAFYSLAAFLIAVVTVAPTAHAQWTITTYKQFVQPQVTSMAIADEYFSGARPARFDASATLDSLDLFESGGNGQFLVNKPFPGLDQPGDTNDFTARVTGTLVVTTAGPYDFFTDSDDGNRFRLDLNQNGTFEDETESIVPDGGLQGTGTPERSSILTLPVGNYKFEVSMFERGGGASVDAGYRVNGAGTQFVLGDAAGGIGFTAPAAVRTVGAMVKEAIPITSFPVADTVRTLPLDPSFPVSESRNVFNLVDSGGDGDFGGSDGVPGLGPPDASDDDDFVIVGAGLLQVTHGQAGSYIFRSNSDDGGRLKIDLSGDGDFNDVGEVVINDDVLSGPHNFDSLPLTLAAGFYAVEYSWFERGGGAEAEVSARLIGTSSFRLLGDEAAGGLDVFAVPEPATFVLTMLGVALLAIRRRGSRAARASQAGSR